MHLGLGVLEPKGPVPGMLPEGCCSLDWSPRLVLGWVGGWKSPRAIPMEVNMPLAMGMLPDWNPTGPGKGDAGMMSTLPYSPAWKLAGSGEEQVTGEHWGISNSTCPPPHCLPGAGMETRLALLFITLTSMSASR